MTVPVHSLASPQKEEISPEESPLSECSYKKCPIKQGARRLLRSPYAVDPLILILSVTFFVVRLKLGWGYDLVYDPTRNAYYQPRNGYNSGYANYMSSLRNQRGPVNNGFFPTNRQENGAGFYPPINEPDSLYRTRTTTTSQQGWDLGDSFPVNRRGEAGAFIQPRNGFNSGNDLFSGSLINQQDSANDDFFPTNRRAYYSGASSLRRPTPPPLTFLIGFCPVMALALFHTLIIFTRVDLRKVEKIRALWPLLNYASTLISAVLLIIGFSFNIGLWMHWGYTVGLSLVFVALILLHIIRFLKYDRYWKQEAEEAATGFSYKKVNLHSEVPSTVLLI